MPGFDTSKLQGIFLRGKPLMIDYGDENIPSNRGADPSVPSVKADAPMTIVGSAKPTVMDIYHGEDIAPGGFATAFKSGIKGCIHKATQGVSIMDNRYAPRRPQAVAAGMKWAAYHFAQNNDPKAQVNWFLKNAALTDDDWAALDWEDYKSLTMTEQQAMTWLKYLMDQTGRSPKGILIYGGNTLKEKISRANYSFFRQFPLWLCQYGNRAKLPAAWDHYTLWQYTGDGVGPLPHNVPGVNTKGIDLNIFGGSWDDWGANKLVA
jgi:lysozyme